MYGILLLSLVLARDKSTLVPSGILFAVLLCFKHIYLYLAPAYFVYLLRVYCLKPRSSFPYFRIQFVSCIKLGAGIIAVFAGAFGPFVFWGQLEQVSRRLFPFSRGLCHAYWAPNVWAMYSFSDRVLIYCECVQNVAASDDADSFSGAIPGIEGQLGCCEQCHSRLGWRYLVRSASGCSPVHLLHLDVGGTDRERSYLVSSHFC